jgi:hypothetical protein
MYEIEKETNTTRQIHDWRSSTYLSVTFLPNKQTEFISTTYYQTLLVDVVDYRLLNQSSFKISASKKIAVVIKWNYQYDASPAAGVPTDTYHFSTGLEIGL